MSEGLIIKYQDLIMQYESIIRYATKTSDVFSVVAFQKKPYSAIPPCTDSDELLKRLEPNLVNKVISKKGWPGTETRCNHRVICIYECCKFSRNELLDMPNFFSAAKIGIPEDICFYRSGVAWLVTVSHEEYAFMYFSTKEDIAFLKENAIEYSAAIENIKYLLPY